jgi:nicotinate-nucleotide--dimethylbenzimidazole phosphoribosyltransferase
MSDVAAELDGLPEPDAQASADVADRAAHVLRPAGAFARLDAIAAWLAGWQRTTAPHADRPGLVVFAADHGVVDEGVTAYPSSITGDVVEALRKGKATAAAMAIALGARLDVVDVGVGQPTGNLALEAALSPERFARCWSRGRDAAAAVLNSGADVLLVGEVGMGNTTAAAAVAAALCGGAAGEWVGRGAGVDDDGLARKVDAVTRAVGRLRPGLAPLEVLREVGGAELVAIAGAVLQARHQSVPVLLDGYVTAAAVLPLELERAGALDHCLAAHRSPEPGHGRLLAHLGLQPLLDLDLRLGEGTGALAAVPLVSLSATAVRDVATFDEWGLEQ